VGGVTEATDVLVGRGAKPPNPPPEDDPRPTGIHAVPSAGDRLGGKYLVDRLLGSGGMGLVLAAKNLETGEQVAIKLLRPKAAGDRIHAERFAREARAIVKIKSDHVVKVFDAGTLSESDAPFIVMEYLSGRDLSQMIREEGAMPLQAAADLMLQICDAVASAHAVGVVHRDLKPSNFFVTKDPVTGRARVKVLDFGIAKAIGQDGVVDPNLTETQAVFGSPTYMSPEQIRSAKHVDHRSDIWSLGVALYEVTTGRLPFAADNVAGLLASIVADPPYYPRGFVPDMPHVFEELLLACLHKDPKQRVQSAGDLGLALAPFATQGPETDALLASIVRSSPPTHQPFPGETGPRMPRISYPNVQPSAPMPASAPMPMPMQMQSAPTTGPIAPESSSRWPGLPPDGQRTSGVAFGSTGSDLHAAVPKPIGRKVATGVGFVLLLGVVGGGAVFVPRFLKKTPPPAPAAVQPSAAPPPSAPASETAAAPPIASIPAPTVSASAEASAKPPPTPKKPPRAHPATTPRPAPAPAKPAVDPTGDRF
jgi:serine/threonine-protein kinase